MRLLYALAATAALTAVSLAQSPLNTLFAANNGGGNGWTMYFDVTLNAPLQFTSLDVNLFTGSISGSVDMYWTPNTYVGNDTNAGAWTLGGSGAVTANAMDTPSSVALSSFTLAPGNYGIALVHNNVAPAYTDGDGTPGVPGSGTNQTYSTAELVLRAGASAGGGLGTGICCDPRVVNCAIGYVVAGTGTVANKSLYGTGCVAQYASFYERFASTPSIDLSNTAFRMLNTGTSYIVLPGTNAFVAPSATATNLNLGDDTEATVTLSSALPYPGGSTSSLVVCSNGFISVASGNGTSYQPLGTALLARPHASWNVWRDFICNATGNVWFEEIGGVAYITWNGVIGYVGTTAGTVTSTFQLQFELATGHVDFVFGSMDTVSVSTWAGGEGYLVGFSPSGASLDPGSVDLSAVLPTSIVLPGNDIAPLALNASARPLVTTTINFDTTNIPAGTPFGAVLLGFTQFNPGIDLTGIGMSGCRQYNEGAATLLFLPGGNTSNSLAFTVPNYIGYQIEAQSVVYAPAAGLTQLGAIASNGLALFLGNL
ncbi:MAG: hypothetical protein H6838_18345 [Planctomycetes bacterium]|nr:hypothetical protein [Planctomycetota bacterium]